LDRWYQILILEKRVAQTWYLWFVIWGKAKDGGGYLRGLNIVVLKFGDLRLDGESRKSRMIVLEVDSCVAVPWTWRVGTLQRVAGVWCSQGLVIELANPPTTASLHTRELPDIVL
jgi:hypothetical protein